MAFGSHAGCAPEASSLILSTRQVLLWHESVVAPRLIALTPKILNGSSLGGCAVSAITAEWWQFRPSRKRMRNVPTGVECVLHGPLRPPHRVSADHIRDYNL